MGCVGGLHLYQQVYLNGNCTACSSLAAGFPGRNGPLTSVPKLPDLLLHGWLALLPLITSEYSLGLISFYFGYCLSPALS